MLYYIILVECVLLYYTHWNVMQYLCVCRHLNVLDLTLLVITQNSLCCDIYSYGPGMHTPTLCVDPILYGCHSAADYF